MNPYCTQGKLVLIAFVSQALLSCSGSGDGGEPAPDVDDGSGSVEEESDDIPFIDWIGSANGTWVVDVNGDAVRFRADTREMHFGSTSYANMHVDIDSALLFDFSHVGWVASVASEEGIPIAALVSVNGFFLDLIGFESDLSWLETNIAPVFLIEDESEFDRTGGRVTSLTAPNSSGVLQRDGLFVEDQNLLVPHGSPERELRDAWENTDNDQPGLLRGLSKEKGTTADALSPP